MYGGLGGPVPRKKEPMVFMEMYSEWKWKWKETRESDREREGEREYKGKI